MELTKQKYREQNRCIYGDPKRILSRDGHKIRSFLAIMQRFLFLTERAIKFSFSLLLLLLPSFSLASSIESLRQVTNQIGPSYLQKCPPFWFNPQSKCPEYFKNMEIFQQNFLDALPNKRTLNLKNFKPINIHIQKGCEEKETYQDNNGVIWVINFTPPSIENYIISGLYKLILGKYTPNEQLIRKNKKIVLLGSEFIADFVSFSRFLNTTNGHRCRKIGKTCLTNRNCFNSPPKKRGVNNSNHDATWGI